MNLRIVPTALLLLLSACATTVAAREEAPDPKLQQALAGKIVGKPKSCIALTDARSSTTYRGAILYRVNSRLSYVNDLGKCPFLRDDNIQVLDVFGSQLCRGDIVRMVDRNSRFPSGSCVFSDFVPYVTPKDAGRAR
ncbi:hypothetical protein [Sphingomonas sp.]|uniref:hypothetical protein n=1 Tax=Sphingomonas sp. TaxID=28214 RepID=UPI0025EE426A|nr:hypothetical protein [Sphingomonas sp.]